MKILSRNLKTSEKVLILILVIILLGLVYFRFVDQNIRSSITSSNAEAESLQLELDTAQAKLTRLQSMKAELDQVESEGKSSRMESYNASKEEIAFLNDVLHDAQVYTISFEEVTRDGDQIRRNMTLQFRTKNYKEAEKIMKKIGECEYRCLIGDLQCNIADDGTTTVGMVATFYETMVGGTADSGLPQDEAATAEEGSEAVE
jgi:hypothetical protein